MTRVKNTPTVATSNTAPTITDTVLAAVINEKAYVAASHKTAVVKT